MKVNFVKESLPKKGVLVVLATQSEALEGWTKELDSAMKGALKQGFKSQRWSGKEKSVLDIISPQGLGVDRLLVVGLGKGKEGEYENAIFEDIGGIMARNLARSAPEIVSVLLPQQMKNKSEKAAALAFGAILGSYRFDKYHTKMKAEDKRQIKALDIAVNDIASAQKIFAVKGAVAQGVYFARDLAHEPANILYPAEFAKRVKALEELGIKVEILKEKQLEKLGMGALLGVGQGSPRESQVVVMKWNGSTAKEAPVALIGKGVCFDTGGISLKPAGGMEDMKADMGGAACVTGTMVALAKRKAKANVVGVIGLVENMPDGNAQRPGDIVKSMSGQTIEVLNTDAEGRLVLADILWYAQEKFKPQAMVNFATLTGAIIIALGKEYAGLFSNNDRLAKQLYDIGLIEREKVWRLPLTKEYNKLIDSKIADIKNISGGRGAGSITAGQFLQRFIKKGQAWAHVDIAATAMGAGTTPISPEWASGFGVRLAHGLIAHNYEKSTLKKKIIAT